MKVGGEGRRERRVKERSFVSICEAKGSSVRLGLAV